MAVKKYSLKTDGTKKVSDNFAVKEFKCNDGSDIIYIDDITVGYLQAARNLTRTTIHINSAYRTATYNKKVGGASNSYHCKGQACDTASTKGSLVLAKIYELLGAKGIGYYPYANFCHVDSRTTKYWWTKKTANSSLSSTASFCGKATIQKVQELLNSASEAVKKSGSVNYPKYQCGIPDGIIGAKTISAFTWFCNHANENWCNKMMTLLKE